ncbi:hypothetical protein [Bradyrhizobium valentinum]|uniref:hypothetical protein n=1 Tax=Bradyrhizobium valentinum TaxID=1518501 RepID=UPI000A460743|nr:hypothetical protein [Bradyrhizobium valentinum]
MNSIRADRISERPGDGDQYSNGYVGSTDGSCSSALPHLTHSVLAIMPAPPLRDQDGKILTHDHPEILDDDYVLRHIVPPHDLHPDTDKGVTRVASGAYSESSDGGMSADILRWMAEDHLDECYYQPMKRLAPPRSVLEI